MAQTQLTLLICYDGSSHAKAAVEEAARLFPAAHADVLVVAEDSPMVLAAAGPLAANADLRQDIEREIQADAHRLADEGARAAIEAGLDAHPLVRMSSRTAWREIVECSQTKPYAAVVIGSRGRSAIRTAILGGASMGVVAHCHRPVVVVHGADSRPPLFELTEHEVADELPSLGAAAR